MAKEKSRPKSIWGKWILPRLDLLTYKDSVFWASTAVFILILCHPILADKLSVLSYQSSIKINDISAAIISFAAILSAISLGMATMLLALPSGRFLEALDRPVSSESDLEKPKNVPYLELAFLSYWTGVSTMFLVLVSVVCMVVGPQVIFIDSSSQFNSFLSGCLAAVTVYVVLQVVACLNAILGASRISYFFRRLGRE